MNKLSEGLLTKETLEDYKKLNKVFIERLESLVTKTEIFKNNHRFQLDRIVDFEFNKSMVEVDALEFSRCGCCMADTYYYKFPENYLYDDNWETQLKEEIEQELQQKEIKKQKALERKRLLNEEEERKQYKQLKEKYDGVEK